jgi:hypothetical protein
MADRLQEACADALERFAEGIFNNPRRLSPVSAEIPVIGGRYFPSLGDEQVLLLLPRICAALCARKRFRWDAPLWAPVLPLTWEACQELEDDDDPRLNLVGLFGGSLRGTGWDYDGHPPFAAFVAGIMAYEHAPAEIRNDPDLRQEFPARELEGLCDGHLYWRSQEMIAFDRDVAARVAAYDMERS